jgi:ABC-type bacteriocin/lantibiotic exporter with double-glycine peptidase domain
MRTFFDLIGIITRAERRRLALIVFGITCAALIDAAGIASVVPFLTLVANSGSPAVLHTLAELRVRFGIATEGEFIVLVGLLSLAVIIVANLLNAWVTWAQVRFTNMLGYSVSRRLLDAYLAKEHIALLGRNSAEMGKNVLSEVDRLVAGALTPALTLVSRIAVAFCTIVFLTAIEPVLALLLAAVFGGLYVLLYVVIRRRMERIGAEAVESNTQRFQVVTEAFSALRELRLYGRVGAFIQRFDAPAAAYARTNATSLIIGQTPKFILEPLAFACVVLMVLYTMGSGSNLAAAMPLIGLFAFAGYRLVPAFQTIFLAVSSIRFYLPALDVVLDELKAATGKLEPETSWDRTPRPPTLRLRDVSFAHGETLILDRIDLTIEPNTTIGLIGRTGGGKTTLASLILGLLTPTSGRIEADGAPLIGHTLAAWQRRIGYVPQDVFLTDDSLAANIALGVPADQIDRALIERAARLANIHDFIESLPAGYDTPAGERGARLSGGQRQRIGIARALYHNPDVVVFDEATSGLDSETEEAVMAAIDRLAGERTLIIIAHRPGALRRAKVVHLVERGRIAASGTLKQLQPLLDLEGVSASAV